jgi:hypothetical protein
MPGCETEEDRNKRGFITRRRRRRRRRRQQQQKQQQQQQQQQQQKKQTTTTTTDNKNKKTNKLRMKALSLPLVFLSNSTASFSALSSARFKSPWHVLSSADSVCTELVCENEEK